MSEVDPGFSVPRDIFGVVNIVLANQVAILEAAAEVEKERDLAEFERDQLATETHRDHLTGLYNEKAFDGTFVRLVRERNGAERRVKLAQPNNDSVMILDLDGFKAVNDEHGHAAGDVVLKAVGQALSTCTRKRDMVARLHGDEFGIILPRITPETAFRRASQMARRIAETTPVTASIGIVSIDPSIQASPEELLAITKRTADQAMYEAKRAGKNRVVQHIAREDI